MKECSEINYGSKRNPFLAFFLCYKFEIILRSRINCKIRPQINIILVAWGAVVVKALRY